MAIRVLMDRAPWTSSAGQRDGTVATDADLAALYAAPDPWLRANMVTSLDGAATGADGKSGSINNRVDQAVFALLRSQSDAIIVGAGTARTEGYRPTDRPLVVVTHSGRVPERLRGAEPGAVLLATHRTAPMLGPASDELGEHVLLLGDDAVDLTALRPALAERGFTRLLTEGGPSLLADLVAAAVVDELCCTVVPTLVAGEAHRILTGSQVEAALTLTTLLESEGTLLGRWLIRR